MDEVLLEEEIKRLLDKLKTLDPAEEEYKKVSDNLTKLYKIKQEGDEIDHNFVRDCNKSDLEIRQAEINNQNGKYDKIVNACKIGIEALAVVVPACIYSRAIKDGFKFESEGNFVSSSTFRNILNKIRPNK